MISDTSLPGLRTAATPSRIGASSVSSPCIGYRTAFSQTITGSGSASAARSSPFASATVAGVATLSPGTCAYQPSNECECCAAMPRPPPLAMRITTGTLSWPPDMWRRVAAVLTIWSSARSEKLIVITSTIGCMPPTAAPMPAPTKVDSESGVSRTRSGPNSSSSPRLTANAPP